MNQACVIIDCFKDSSQLPQKLNLFVEQYKTLKKELKTLHFNSQQQQQSQQQQNFQETQSFIRQLYLLLDYDDPTQKAGQNQISQNNRFVPTLQHLLKKIREYKIVADNLGSTTRHINQLKECLGLDHNALDSELIIKINNFINTQKQITSQSLRTDGSAKLLTKFKDFNKITTSSSNQKLSQSIKGMENLKKINVGKIVNRTSQKIFLKPERSNFSMIKKDIGSSQNFTSLESNNQ